MKRIAADKIGFTEIGGAGEIIYRVVRFKGYFADYDHEDKAVILPVIMPGIIPVEGTDYRLNGQELLYSLCNLYYDINKATHHPLFETEYIRQWCKTNIQPYNFKALSSYFKDSEDDILMIWEIIQREASFYVDTFIKDLCTLGRAMEFYHALVQANEKGNPSLARELAYEGRLCDGFPFFEKYSQYEDDAEYIRHIREDYNALMDTLTGLFPEFHISLQRDEKSGRIGMYADIDSVFDICWYTFSRLVAEDAPKMDDDMDDLFSNGSYICCLACGRFIKRTGPGQKYCQTSDCQDERKRRKSKQSYHKLKAKKPVVEVNEENQ